MKFYDRKKEFKALSDLGGPARIAVVGRRRIGKTTLVERFFGERAITFFVPSEKAQRMIIQDWVREHPDKHLPALENFKDFFEQVFLHHKDSVVFIDEFQNITNVAPSFLYDLQHLIDKHHPDLVVTGSLISVMKGVVEAYKSPLYGRFDLIIKLKELDLLTVVEICRDMGLSFENTLRLYSVFGGIPKYYDLISRSKGFDINETLASWFILYPHPLFEEVRTMLKEEFGSEFKTYFTILYAISQGSNRSSEIAGALGRKETDITKYLANLKDEFEIIERHVPITGGRRGHYTIKDKMTAFWFKTVWKHYSLMETGQERKARSLFERDMQGHISRAFEEIVREVIPLMSPFEPMAIGRQWGRMQGLPKGSDQYEIDVMAVNDLTREALFVECKWQDDVDARAVLENLKRKAACVDWNLGNRREHYAIFAKSFGRRTTGAKLVDLNGLKEILS